jgi:ketosteroid isomerase-like protein
MTANALDVARQLFERIEAKHVDGVAALYADDVEVWHNFDNATQTKAENLKVLGGLTKNVAEIRYDVTERILLGERVMQRHLLRCRVANGEEVVIPACIFVTVRGGRIVRIDEYLDTGQSSALGAAIQRSLAATRAGAATRST